MCDVLLLYIIHVCFVLVYYSQVSIFLMCYHVW